MSNVEIDVRVSGLYQMTSTVVSSSGSCLLVDPGYFPRELEELKGLVEYHGELQAMAFTHGHWDHVVGHLVFPDVPVWVSKTLARDIEEKGDLSTVNIEKVRQFDSRYYVKRPGPYRWPKTVHALSDGEQVLVGDVTVQALHLPGHSRDSLALKVEGAGLLLAGDYLSPCEIPFIDDFQEYYKTLHRLISILDSGDVHEVVPGHGYKMPRDQARDIARDDLSYLYQLMHFRDSGEISAVRYMLLPRASDEVGMRERHMENCKKLGVDFTDEDAGRGKLD
jgi:glyoxylase-like metal-dependent hydrolase (beta-lactamase superfamily II)